MKGESQVGKTEATGFDPGTKTTDIGAKKAKGVKKIKLLELGHQYCPGAYFCNPD